MDQEEILRLGIRAGTVLGSDVMFFIKDMQGLLLEALANTQHHETKTRESLYFQYKGMRDLVDGLHQYVQAAQAIAKAEETAQGGGTEE